MLESNRDDADWEPLERWYVDHVRPLLERLDAARTTEIETDLKRLRQTHERLNDELCTCFLGSSGIGKSTLINALVAGHEEIVPAGGVGPLTAQALTVRYADAGSFEAKYHDAGKLNQLRFVLEGGLRAKAAQPDGVAASPDDSLGLPFDEADELRSEVSNEDDESGSRAEKFRKQARLLVTGDQNSSDGDSDTPYLVDGLRQALGQESLFNSELTADDAARVKRLRELLIRDGNQWPSRTLTLHEGDSHFRERLAEHATGFLSPMIESLDVRWRSELLAHGVSLVDLPGLGIAGDVYRDVTQKYVKERAKAIVLVVGNRGITESDAQLLHASGFLNRLLHSAYDTSADMASLIIAVTRIDDIADDEYTKDKAKPKKKKREHFAIAQEKSRHHVLNQIRSKLEEAWSLAGEGVSGIKRTVIETIIERMSIFPVSAPQYRKCLAQDEDDPAFIQLPAASGIPEMVAGLRERADLERDDRWRCYVEARNLLIERLLSTLRVIQHQWQEDSRAEEEAERLRQQLLHFLQPLREEFRVRQGAFREFLKATLPQRIKALVADAKLATQRSIRAYLKKEIGVTHVRTLQAAVSRGGAYRGSRHIDLPRDFAFAFEEPIAEVWGKTVLPEIRQRTGEFADDCVTLVNQVIGWATENGVLVNAASVSNQREVIRGDSRKLKAIGEAAVGGLREKVKNKLTQAIEPTIRERCKSFVDADLNKRAGTRDRIMVMFDELATDAVDSAAPHAEAILLDCYRAMENEMLQAFFEAHADPLQEAADAIIESRENRQRRSDATERVEVLSQIELALRSSPPLTIATGTSGSGAKS